MFATIRLSEIKPSTPRVRLTQSTEKLQELADSIREEGVIVPVKVRKNGEGYTLIYGHRRVAAAKMAGLKEIEAIVEDVPEKKLLTQALIENVVREGMVPLETAKALQTILDETGCTQDELAAKMGWSDHGAVGGYLAMLAPELGLTVSAKGPPAVLTPRQVQEAKAGTDNIQDAAKVLKYAGEKDLSARDTRQVAEVVRKASAFGGAKAVARVLARPYREIEATARDLPARKAKEKAEVRVVTGKIKFQWVKDPRVILAEEGFRAISAVISAIARSDEDKGGGKAVLKDLRHRLTAVLKQIDSVLQ